MKNRRTTGTALLVVGLLGMIAMAVQQNIKSAEWRTQYIAQYQQITEKYQNTPYAQVKKEANDLQKNFVPEPYWTPTLVITMGFLFAFGISTIAGIVLLVQNSKSTE